MPGRVGKTGGRTQSQVGSAPRWSETTYHPEPPRQLSLDRQAPFDAHQHPGHEWLDRLPVVPVKPPAKFFRFSLEVPVTRGRD